LKPPHGSGGRSLICSNCGTQLTNPHLQNSLVEGEESYEGTPPATRQDPSPITYPQQELMSDREIEFNQRLYSYADEHYPDFLKYAEECPDYLEGLEPEFYYKQVITWFVTEKVLPSTGKTVLEEFVEKCVVNEDPEIAARMLQRKDVIRGSFRILDDRYLPVVPVEHLETGRRYVAFFKGEAVDARYRAGEALRAKIHPWREGCYMFDGIIVRMLSDEEWMRRLGMITPSMMPDLMKSYEKQELSRYESIMINDRTSLHAAMNKYPSQWVDGICVALGITIIGKRKEEKVKLASSRIESGYFEELLIRKKLSPSSMQALKLLKGNGWLMKYGQLTSRFSHDVGLRWSEKPPSSDLGLLRLHGLLVVGKMPAEGKMYKAAAVPVEARASIERVLSADD
jgi:hypothetical protein